MRPCFSCGDDPNDLFTTFILTVCARDQENHDTTGEAERLPPYLWALVSILDRQVVWIIEHEAGGLKTHSMLGSVRSILIFFPRELHRVVTLL